MYADILWRTGKETEARAALKSLDAMHALIDLDLPVMRRLEPLARSIGLDLGKTPARRADFGERPELASLGPLHWTSPTAPAWSLTDGKGRRTSASDYRGRPLVMMFFLGRGCVHCMEQLNAFADVADAFGKAGIALVAVSTDSSAGVKETGAKGAGRFPFPVLSDPSKEAFRAFRAYDGFEQAALHGTLLIDGQGSVRWQDISYEPFLETSFLLTEAKRLLEFRGGSKSVTAAKTRTRLQSLSKK